MIKCIILNGIPIVMEAFVSLAKVEKAEDQDHSFTRHVFNRPLTQKRIDQLTIIVEKAGRLIKQTISGV
jgi:hypothetical protein